MEPWYGDMDLDTPCAICGERAGGHEGVKGKCPTDGGHWHPSQTFGFAEPIPATPSARPDWLTDEGMAEMRRLEGSSRDNPVHRTPAFHALDLVDADAHHDSEMWWCYCDGVECWLTPAGHKALAAIEAEEGIGKPLPDYREATGYQLDMLANALGLERRDSEADQGLRHRMADWAYANKEPCQSPRERIAELTKYLVDLGPPITQGDRESSAPDDVHAKGARRDGHQMGPFITDPEERAAYIAVASGIEPPAIEVTISLTPRCPACNDEGYIPGLATPMVPCPRCGR